MSQVKKNKQSFGSFINKYRKIIFIALFFMLLPIAIVIGLYSGTKINGQKIKFAAEEEIVDFKNFVDIDEFNAFTLKFEYKKIEDIFDTEGDNKKIGHKYTFNISYEKNIQEVTNVSIRSSLVGPWSNYQQYEQSKQALKLVEGRNQTIVVEFKKLVPYYPLWFVKVTHPIMYLEVKYNIAGLVHTSYLVYDLSTAKNVEVI
ncbi:MAG: hypothetical protein ACOX5X_03665 [Acholeplasmataceae bacterium]|jgi:hypothetical protein